MNQMTCTNGTIRTDQQYQGGTKRENTSAAWWLRWLLACGLSFSFGLGGGIALAAPPLAPTTQSVRHRIPTTRVHKRRISAAQSSAQKKAAFARLFRKLQERTLRPQGGLFDRLKLVYARDIQRILNEKRPLTALFLQGIPRSPHYDALQFVTTKGRLLMAVQIWKEPRTKLRKRWQEHVRTYPNVQRLGGSLTRIARQPSPVGRVSLVAHRHHFYYFQFVASHRDALVSMTCHVSACLHQAPLLRLARLIDRRLTQQSRHPKQPTKPTPAQRRRR